MTKKKYYLCHVKFTGVVICFLLFVSFTSLSFANDTVTEITPKGLQFKKEKNISIEKEELYISLKKVEVSYIFKNHSDKDITVEVAFPVPPFGALDAQNGIYSHSPINFSDFTVEVDSKRIDYKKEVKATVNGKDYADILKNLGVSIENFGNFYSSKPYEEDDISKISEGDKKRLLDLKVLFIEDKVVEPNWTVDIKYHWTQTFPANSTVNIKHSYTPYHGGEYEAFQKWKGKVSGEISEKISKEGCLDQKIKKAIEKKIVAKVEKTDKRVYLTYSWISYILTTANNWRKPIKDFHLIVESPENMVMSLCFDHKLIKTSPTRSEVHIENFIPTKDLKVYFISGQ